MEKRKRKELTLKEKVDLIKLSDGKKRQLAETFGIGKTQVQTILKRKAELLDGYYEQNSSGDRKRLCKRSPVEELNVGVVSTCKIQWSSYFWPNATRTSLSVC